MPDLRKTKVECLSCDVVDVIETKSKCLIHMEAKSERLSCDVYKVKTSNHMKVKSECLI